MGLDRREFSRRLTAAAAALFMPVQKGAAQQVGTMEHPVMGEPTPGPATGEKPKGAVVLPVLKSGVYTPGGSYGSLAKRTSHRYLLGMLAAGNIQLELHETIQEVGALHEPTDKHKHNEMWFVQKGVCELTINGITRRMNAGDVGLVCAGDEHYIRNAGSTACTYFVATLGPPEQY